MEANALRLFAVISKQRMLNHYLPKLKQCLASLNAEMIWRKEPADANSIGGIAMHLIAHIDRNAVRLRNPEVRYAEGIEDHFPDAKIDKASLAETLDRTFEALRLALDEADPGSIDMHAVYHMVEHAGYHCGQIVDRTQRMTGVRLRFAQRGLHEQALRGLIRKELSQ